MIREKINNDFKSDNVIQNIDIIKGYFEKKNATCSANNDLIYQYLYKDKFKNKERTISCSFNLKEIQANIVLSTDISEEDSIYEIDDILNKIFADIMKILFGGKNNYIIRVYGRYYLSKSIDLNDTFNWKNNINLSSYNTPNRYSVYNVDNLTSCPKENIIYCDIEVNAYNLSSARSMAYNLFLEFISLLSVLLDLGIEPYTSKENFLLLDEKLDFNKYKFWSTIGSCGIDDTELGLLVFDNMNGLIAIDENGEMILNTSLIISSSNINYTQTSYNEVLEKIFKNRKLKKQKKKYECKPISNELTFYNSYPKIFSEHCSFFRKVVVFEKEHIEKYNYFFNACKLYNYAHCIGSNNPTAMIAYLIASIEALSKSEKSEKYIKDINSDMDKFIIFCKKYFLGNDFDEKFLKYLYGKIRSGHFHSGEFYFFEYSCNFDLSFNNEFFKMRDIHIKARQTLRKVFINWIKINILQTTKLD
ncbi:hypothetical protein ACSXBY_15450 (plasmid) [Clostridium perfringens]|uniref:hypothetical protein n=1 Tax=Clostridium perfringens TaxID=1502 RepID=UPI0001666E68|nr:hypothetical protein [Clostridium perfringens]EDS79329.1 hypothetical protein CPC_A0224 [Clostridium perfringens C str. JGS1495]PWX16786.1 hypothetical protein CYK65_15130 [Clostridium perfringens]